jgi:hypothetical protein
MKHQASRNGYSMLLVMVFLALMSSLLGVAHRQIASALRVQTAQQLQDDRDTGSLHALARGLALLETGLPDSNPYVCGVTIGSPPDERSYTVTFESSASGVWSVRAAPTEWPDSPPPIPATFAGGN